MKKTVKNMSIAFSMLLILYACGPRVQTGKTANVDLDNYQTYAWLPNGDSIQNDKYDDELLNQTIVQEVNQEMQAKGYTLDRTNPDLLVLVHTMFDEETSTVREPIYATYDYYAPGMYVNPYYDPYYYYDYNQITSIIGYDVDQVEYTEGTLVIDLIDKDTNTVVWRGTAEDYVRPYNLRVQVANYIDEIFDEFPAS